MKKILCMGEALIDMICSDTGRSLSEGEHFVKKPGGAPANVAAVIAALGGSVELAAKVGADPFGKFLAETLQSFGVSTNWIREDKDHFTTLAFVSLMENGDRDFYFNRGADGELSADEIKNIPLEEFSIVHFGSATAFLPGPLNESYQWLLENALQKKCFICFDPNYRQLLFGNNQPYFIDQCLKLIPRCDFLKLSNEEAFLLTGTTTVESAATSLAQKSSAVFAITMGSQGALLGHQGQYQHIPGIPVEVLDTTGAGDAFAGAILYQLSKFENASLRETKNEDWVTIIQNANRVGALTCRYLGAMEAFRHLDKDFIS